ncbi:hypothetical protein E3T61_07385 [Cryobacterium lactosi]|uniref:Uncharacterized protein n=1 Tax=Cryobacterium lactosi TaxID=1259202 RepID=A0A4R9BXS4_9MICO|nr:hypothetical protein [Cryobacterium lactosi]TFD92121.1 hypothetical protein E3T61_07385 [Cryobacterium lactosi]
MSGIDESSQGPKWLIDLSGPVRQNMRDPRLDNARAALIEVQPQLIALDATVKQVETALRDCAEAGMSADEIAVQISLSMDVVKRVLNGGSFLGSDYG